LKETTFNLPSSACGVSLIVVVVVVVLVVLAVALLLPLHSSSPATAAAHLPGLMGLALLLLLAYFWQFSVKKSSHASENYRELESPL